ncbi:MAG: alpha/beta hydrolase [Bryobacteraceae bacterium]
MKPLTILSILMSMSAAAPAQPPAGRGGAGQAPDTLLSPEVHADRTVTFRLRAPKASEVTVTGEWMLDYPSDKTPLTRDGEGVWSVTVGPLTPNIYLYSFNVDGMDIADPINPTIKLRARTSASLVLVPGGQAWEFSDVPHGVVNIVWHKSAVLDGAMRQVFVYTPPGYGRNAPARYPVLYLLHGNQDVAAGWTLTGSANLILDNLIAEKKAVPMIVVMTNGHAVPYGTPPAEPGRNNQLFEEYLLKEVVPMVETNYRVAAGRTNRAIAGLSMGGGQATQIGLGHLDLFAWVGVFSAGQAQNFETRYKALLDDPRTTNERLKLLFIGVGKTDPGYGRVKQFAALLTEHKIQHIYWETEGAHVWPVWRRCLVETASRLFQKTPPHAQGE